MDDYTIHNTGPLWASQSPSPKDKKHIKLKITKPTNHHRRRDTTSQIFHNRDAIITALTTMRRLANARQEHFRAMAYTKAINSIQSHFQEKDIQKLSDVIDLPSIGQRIQEKITEILQTGTLQAAQSAVLDPEVATFDELTSVYSIGGAKARELIDTYHITSLDNLRQRQDEVLSNGRSLLNPNQKIGLRYYEDIQHRIPRDEMLRHEQKIKHLTTDLDPRFEVEVVGSFRRGKTESGDIDVLIRHPSDNSRYFDRLIEHMQQSHYLKETLIKGAKKYCGLSRLPYFKYHRRIDILFTSRKQYPFALYYFTGSGNYNPVVRQIAHNQGFRLNENGIIPLNTQAIKKLHGVVFETEDDIVRFLGLPLLEPHQRVASAVTSFLKVSKK